MIAHDAEECECCEKTIESRAEVERLKALLREVRENVRVTPHMGGEVSNPSIRDHKAMCEWVRRVARLDGSPAPRMYTEEQVLAYGQRVKLASGNVAAIWDRAAGNKVESDVDLKALLESP